METRKLSSVKANAIHQSYSSNYSYSCRIHRRMERLRLNLYLQQVAQTYFASQSLVSYSRKTRGGGEESELLRVC